MDAPVSIDVTRFGPADLAGAMLRKSFARRPIRVLSWPPAVSAVAAFLTAGLWPTGLFILRLWLYASHHRFRISELARWLGESPSRRSIRRVRPTLTLILAGCTWLAAVGLVLSVVWCVAAGWLGWQSRAPADPRRWMLSWAAASAGLAAPTLLITAVLFLRLRVDLALRSLLCGAPELRKVSPDIGARSLWPMLLPALAVPWLMLGWHWAAWWTMLSILGILAAEVQRGYITVADRRLRYAVARVLGRIMRNAPDSR